jgi:hypothetical protein
MDTQERDLIRYAVEPFAEGDWQLLSSPAGDDLDDETLE